MLHLIFQTPLNIAVLQRIDACDDVVLQGGAVWNAVRGHVLQSELESLLAKNCRLHVLREELELNGIAERRLQPGVDVIDYAGLVELTVSNKVNKTWR